MQAFSKEKNIHKISFLIIVLITVLCFCVAIGSTIAWLFIDYTHNSTGITVGDVKLELYNNGTLIANDPSSATKVRTQVVLAGGNTTRTISLKTRNVGNINGLLRATINMYFLDAEGNQVQALQDANLDGDNDYSVTFGSDWVYNFPDSVWTTNSVGTVMAGQIYLNKVIEPYVVSSVDNSGSVVTETKTDREITIISGITVNNALKDTNMYIDITLDICAHAGNIYSKINEDNATLGTSEYPVEAYPFGKFLTGDPRGGWFLDYWTAWEVRN